MTEIMRMLPKDLQREVWSFIGMVSLGMTPSAEIINNYYEDQQEYCYEFINEDDLISVIDKGDRINGRDMDGWGFGHPSSFWYNKQYSVRFYFQRKVFRENKELYDDKYKHIELFGELGEWINAPKCNYCNYDLTLYDFKLKEDYEEYSCSACYGINNDIIGDRDVVDDWCNNCDKMLVGEEWRFIMNKEEGAGMCLHCIDMGNSDEEEEEFISDDEEEEKENI